VPLRPTVYDFQRYKELISDCTLGASPIDLDGWFPTPSSPWLNLLQLRGLNFTIGLTK
jgi:hypothetical protein